MNLPDDIPAHLAPPAKAALLWINDELATSYSLTGLVGANAVENISEPFELGLVLCDGELCTREQVRITPEDEAYNFSFIEQAATDIPPLLDPPEAIRSEWLEKQFEKFKFVVLLYYRGLW